MATLAPVIRQRFFDANGNPLAGGKVFTYEAGTSTPLPTYTDQSGTVENTNPVILDSSGEADIWIGLGPYKFVVKTASDIVVTTVDDIRPFDDATILDSSITTPKINDLAVTTAKIADGSVTNVKLAANAVETAKILDANVTTSKIANLAVTNAKIADGAITQAKRAALGQQISTQLSGVAAEWASTFGGGSVNETVSGLSVTITTTGRPVFITLISNESNADVGTVQLQSSTTSASVSGTIHFRRAGNIICSMPVAMVPNTGSTNAKSMRCPPGCFNYIDVVAAGTYTYTVGVTTAASNQFNINYVRLAAYEL
jgi:hypothetical protein